MFKQVKFTILTENQIYGIFRKRDIIPKMLNLELNNGRLELFNKIPQTAKATDYAIVQNALYYEQPLNNSYLIKTEDLTYNIVTSKGHKKQVTSEKSIGIRPVFEYREFLNHKIHQNEEGLYEFTYGEYPEKVMFKDEAKAISYKIPDSKLFEETGKTTKIYHLLTADGKIQTYSEYLIDNEKFIIVKGQAGKEGEYTLSTDEIYHPRDNVYIKIKPIVWYLDKESNLAISKDILFTIPLSLNSDEMRKYLQTVFAKDLISSKTLKKIK